MGQFAGRRRRRGTRGRVTERYRAPATRRSRGARKTRRRACCTALCINGGGKHPKAVNKTSVSAAGDFPVQNGKAEGTLSLTASFQPECTPPMTVQFTDVTLTDETSGATANISGTF